MASTIYIDEGIGLDSTDANGSQDKPYKSVQFAFLQHGQGPEYQVKKENEWAPAAKAALKKAANYAEAQKKKAAKEKELAIREAKEQEQREKALEEAKKIVIKEAPSLPKAVQIRLSETRPEIVKLGSGERSKDVDYSSGNRGTRVRVYGYVHRERKQKEVLFITLRDDIHQLQCVLTGDLAKTYDAVSSLML
jgi:asparaginyl-tRNA synthetase